jgi:hypothetical protein
MPTPAYVTVPNPATGDVVAAAHIDDLATNSSYFKDRVDNPPFVRVSHSATQSIADATDTTLSFDTEALDTGGTHDNATNNSRITIPTGESGYWLFVAVVEFAANAIGTRKVSVRFNGSAIFGQTQVPAATAGNATWITVPVLLNPGAGDYLTIVVSQNSGGALNVNTTSLFSAVRI